ncbi:type II toxin-antitoxin system HicA family toxin [Calothrix sp. FACHB-156]|nr:type II toxin-antitoxin system HicA family toxin [Calothrix sp. FACHB-156]
MLKKFGIDNYKPAKGSHSKWIHPKLPQAIIIAGKDGNDAKPYLEKQVNEALEQLKIIEVEPEETEE